MQTPKIEDWGLTDYLQALTEQEKRVREVADSGSPGVVIFCHHPPVVTLGRKTSADDLQGWQGPIVEIGRGGRATYHGPSQIVMYPIWNLDYPSANTPHRDIHFYLRGLELVMVQAMREFGIEAQGRSLANQNETGLWVGERKLASIGIGVRRWVCFHGLALNVDHDPRAFQGIRPCGMSPDVMTSMEELMGHPVDQETVKASLLQNFMRVFWPPREAQPSAEAAPRG